MELLNVILAAVAGSAFGAFWYSTFAKPWMAHSGVPIGEDGQPTNSKDPKIYAIAFVSNLLVAGMMRHVFELSDIDTLGKGLVSGLGIGLFLAAPWTVVNHVFSGRSRTLIMIDLGFATLGCTVIALVLTLI